MSRNKWNCSIAVCAFNRPHYFSQCLESVSKTPDIIENNVPVYIFCDGGKDATQKENGDIIAKYSFVTKTFYQTENLCIAKHIHYLRETIFDKMGYDRLMFLEDDVLVSPYYYRFMNRVLDFYEEVDPTIGMVNSSLACHESLSEKLGKQNYFWDVGFHINNYIIQKKTWEIIKPTMEEYLEKFITPASSYYTIDYDSIIKWARRKFSFPFLQPHNKLFFDNLCGTQDSISNMAMRINNIRYISSYVNRGLYIGRHGSHCDDKLFDELRFSGVVLDIIPNDVKEIKSIWDMNLKKEYRNI